MKKNLQSILVSVPLLLALALAGCSKTEEKAPAPAPKAEAPAPRPVAAPAPATVAAQAKPAGVPAAALQKQHSSATAVAAGPAQPDFRNRTDPFKPYAAVVVPVPVKPEQAAARPSGDQLPIQSFEASRFRVSGIIAGLKANRALILDPNGRGYVVQEGMLIGSNSGRITRITASSVEVIESFKDERGKSRKRTIVLTLAKKR